MSFEQRVEIVPEIIWREMDGNAVVVSPKDGQVRVFNEVGTSIWHALIAGETVAQIKERLIEVYDVSEAQATQDLDSFLKELLDRGILNYNA